MRYGKSKIIIFLVLSLLIANAGKVLSISDSTNITVLVGEEAVVCVINNICDTASGETESNCPADCGCNNNGTCESNRGETESSCSSDCSTEPPVTTPNTDSVVLPKDNSAPSIFNLTISKITQNSAEISWETNELAFCQIMLGKTQEYEIESSLENIFSLVHFKEIKNLSSGNDYHFKLICYDTAENRGEIVDHKFSTLSEPDITPPANISLFSAEAKDSQISLAWQNPKDDDFAGVIILRSEKFFPSNPSEGEIVYDGVSLDPERSEGQNFLDQNLENGKRYYYSAFSYDKTGNFSSGAIVSAVPFRDGFPVIVPPIEIQPGQSIPEIEKLNLKEFDFFQGDKKIKVSELGQAEITQDEPLKISIEYGKVPEVLKTIMITLEEESGKLFSFLLRVNKEKTAYTATIYPPPAGRYPLILTILDYKNQSVKKITGELYIIQETKPISAKQVISSNKIFYIIIPIILIILLIIILIIIRLISRKKKDIKKTEYKYLKKYKQ